MSLVAELRRRHVFKIGGAYVVIAWLVVQAASIAFPAFQAPEWVLRVFILILMLGFPIALVMAWAFDSTPEGLKLEPAPLGNKRMALITGALVVLALTWYFVGQPAVRDAMEGERRESGSESLSGPDAATPPNAAGPENDSAPLSPPAAPRKSIAVLPFVNMSADKDNEYFSDGISEELLNVLVRVPGLGVASRTSSFAYKGRAEQGAAKIARELNVAHILEGSVRKSGTRVRITAQLIDAASDRHLWSETYDRELDDIFAIQDEIAKAIVAALRVKLDATDPAAAVVVRADTDNMQAYDVYLKARGLFIARRDLKESVRLFERAIELDPKFARAYEGLAAVAAVMRGWGHDDRDYFAMVGPAATRALELDPSLSTPWAARSMQRKQTWPIDYALALADLEKAIAADPRNSTAVFWRGIAWIELGYFDRAVADLDRCLELEPGYHNCRSHKALALLLKGDEEAALIEYERTVVESAYLSRNDHFIAPLMRRGNRLAALLLLDLNDVQPELRAILVKSIQHPGAPHPDAKALVTRHVETATTPNAKNLGESRLYLWLGDLDRMSEGDASDIANTQIMEWERDPPTYRNSPAMKHKLVASGVVAYWRQHGFPPQCRAVGTDDLYCD